MPERNEALAELKYEWLTERGASFADVMFDEDNQPYILQMNESDHSDTYQIDYKPVYLPRFTDADADKWLIANN